jgi:predicted O-linked N-acetylglucosamine transferase (SPINDLY family)
MPDVADRIAFFNPLSRSDFLALNAACDAILVPFPFGAGNSSFDAFSVGAPCVTMDTDLLRGRITAGLYRAMNLEHHIAPSTEAYIQLALQLGTQPDFREQRRREILDHAPALFESPKTIPAFEAFFISAMSK